MERFNKFLICLLVSAIIFTGLPLQHVNAAVLSDDECVVADKLWLEENFLLLNDYPYLPWLKTDLMLPTTGLNGSQISWSSSNSSVLTNAGVVTRPAYSGINAVDVVLTATITKNAAATSSVFEASVVSLPGSLALQLDYEDLEYIANLVQINGSAQAGEVYISNPHLFSLNNSSETAGSVFTKQKIQLGEDLSFSTYFVFDITSTYFDYDEGFTFTVQADSSTVVGSGPYEAMGVPSAAPSISVEIDTKRDSDTATYEYAGSDTEQHIAVYLNGDYQHPLAIAPVAVYNLETGERHLSANQRFKVWIQYNGSSKKLEVLQVYEGLEDPTTPILSVDVDLNTIFQTSSGQPIRDVYPGFTGHGADAFSVHASLYEWSFKNDPYPISYDLPPYTIRDLYRDAFQLELTAQTIDAEEGFASQLTAVLRDSLAQPVPGVPLVFTSDFGTLTTAPAGGFDTLSVMNLVTDELGSATLLLTSPIEGNALIRCTAQGGAFAETTASLILTEEAKLNLDYNHLTPELLLQANRALNFVRSDLILPTSGANGSSITWSSSNTTFLDTTGKVTRPTLTEGDQVVILRALLSLGAFSRGKDFKVVIKINDADMVTSDANWLTDVRVLQLNPSLSEVTTNIAVPTVGAAGSTISWVSSNEEVISSTGFVNRPAYPNSAVEVQLTATIAMGVESMDKTFTMTVLPTAATDYDLLQEAYNALAEESILNANSSLNPISSDLNLPELGLHDCSIAWSSSKPEFVSANGFVVQPDYRTGSTSLFLTATLRKGTEELQKLFYLTVIAKEPTDAEAVAETVALLTAESILNGNTALDQITKNLYLPPEGSYGSRIVWESSDPLLVSSLGEVSQPSFTEGNKSMTLTARISRAGVEAVKEFSLTIIALSATDQEALALSLTWLTDERILAANTSADQLQMTLNLPISGLESTQIRWSCLPVGRVVTEGLNIGELIRPSYTTGDQAIVLTAQLLRGTKIVEKSFNLTMKALPMIDAEALELDLKWFDIQKTLGTNPSPYSLQENLQFDLNAPNGSVITLSSSHPTVLAIVPQPGGNAIGNVTRPDYEENHQSILVTVTLQKGVEQRVKTFEYTVLALRDITPPTLISPKPDMNAPTFLYGTNQVVLTFDENIQPRNRTGGYAYYARAFNVTVNGAMPDTVILIYENNTLTVRDQSGSFAGGFNEIVIPASAVLDMAGNPLGEEIRIQFLMEEKIIQPLNIISSVPANGANSVQLDTPLTFRLSSSDISKGNNFNLIGLSNQQYSTIPIVCELTGGDVTIKMKYAGWSLRKGQVYLLFIPPGAFQDRFGNQSTATLISFVTIPEDINLQISKTYPQNNQASVSILQSLQVELSHAATVAQGKISLTDPAGNAVAIAVDAFTTSDHKILIDPIEPLQPYTQYTVTIPKSYAKARLSGVNLLVTDAVFRFTTGANELALLQVAPSDLAVERSMDTRVQLTFSDTVTAGPNNRAIKMRNAAGEEMLMIQTLTGEKAEFRVLNEWLSPQTTYTVSIPAGAYINEENQANDSYSFSFTTGQQLNLKDQESFTVNPATRWLVQRELSFKTDALFYAFRNRGRSITSYAWDFGDSASASGLSAKHTYTTPGTYTVKLNVIDQLGISYELQRTLEISNYNAEDVTMQVSPKANQNLVHTDVYSDPLDLFPGRRLYTIDLIYNGVYMAGEVISVSLYKNNALVRDYGTVTTTNYGREREVAQGYFGFDYHNISLNGTYELVFRYQGLEIRRTVVIRDQRSKQDLRIKLFDTDTGSDFQLYNGFYVELDGNKTFIQKTYFKNEDRYYYVIKGVELGFHTIKVIPDATQEPFVEHSGQLEFWHSGWVDVSILQMQRTPLGEIRVWSEQTDSRNSTPTTFVGGENTFGAPPNLNFTIEANWEDYRTGYYEVQLNDWKTYRYSEPKFSLNPLDLYPGNMLLVRAVTRYGNASPWVDAKLRTIDPPEINGVPIEFQYVNGQLVAQTSMFLNSNSAGQNSEINDMPMLGHNTSAGLMNHFDSLQGTMNYTPEGMEMLLEFEKSGSYGKSKKKPKLLTVGYQMEGEMEGSFFLSYNNVTDSWQLHTGQVILTGDISKYYKKGYTVPVIRLGAEATLTLGTILGGTLYIDKRPDAEHEYSGILKVEPYVTVEVYGGVEGWNIEGGVDGRIKTQLHIPTGYIQVNPSLTAYVQGTLAFVTTTFYEDEATTSWNNGKDKVVAPKLFSLHTTPELAEDTELVLIPRNYLNSESLWLATAGQTDSMQLLATDTEQVLKTQVYPYAEVQMVEQGQNLAMVWLDDNPDRSSVNRTQLHYALNIEGTWTEPVRLNQDGTADFTPVLAASSEGALLVWQNLKQVLPDEPSLDNYAKNTEISVNQTLYRGTGDLDTITLTDDALYDHSPSIVMMGNLSGLVVWTKSQGLDFSSAQSDNMLCYASWDGTTWSEAATLQDDLSQVVYSQLFSNDEQALLLYILDADNDTSTTADWEIYARIYHANTKTWDEAVRITNNEVIDSYPQAVYQSGNWFLTWNQGDHFQYQVGLNGESKTEAALDGISPNYALTGDDEAGSLIALVYQKAEEKNQRNLSVLFYDTTQGIWGNPSSLTLESGYTRSFSPLYSSSRGLTVAFTAAEIITEVIGGTEYFMPGDKVALSWLTYTPKHDVAIPTEDAIDVSAEIPFPGTSVTVSVLVENRGDFAEQATVNLYRGAPELGMMLGEVSTATPIPANSSVWLELDWLLEQDESAAYDLYAVVSPALGVLEVNPFNNTAHRLIQTADLALNQVPWRNLIGEEYVVSPVLINNGALTLQNIEVTVEYLGDTLATGIIESLLPGDQADLDFMISTQALVADLNGRYPMTVKILAAAGVTEVRLDNNQRNFTLFSQAPVVNSSTLSNGEKNVSVDESPQINFDRPIAQGDTFAQISLSDAHLNSVAISVEVAENSLKLTPQNPLQYSTEFRVHLPMGAIEDRFGVSLQQPYSLNFTTGPKRPQMIFSNPGDQLSGVDPSQPVRVKYNKDVQPGPSYERIELLSMNEATETKPVTIWTSIQGEWLTISGFSSLEENTSYTLTLPKGAVQDADLELQAQDTVISFTTGTRAAVEPEPEQPQQPPVEDPKPESTTTVYNTETLVDLIQSRQGITFRTPNGTLILTPEQVQALSMNGTQELEITILPKEQDDDPARVSQIFEYSLLVGGEPVSEFTFDIILQVPLDPEKISNSQQVIVYLYDAETNTWLSLGGKVDVTTGMIRFSTRNLGLFAAFENEVEFIDLTSDWAKDPVRILAARQIIQGTGQGFFEPLGQVTRAEFTTILVRSLYLRDSDHQASFNDVTPDKWFAESIAIAAQLGLIQGVAPGQFAPERTISREQLAVMSYRLVQLKNPGLIPEGSSNLVFLDAQEISEYARSAVAFLASQGILLGFNGEFYPLATASRQEAAVILYRLLTYLGDF